MECKSLTKLDAIPVGWCERRRGNTPARTPLDPAKTALVAMMHLQGAQSGHMQCRAPVVLAPPGPRRPQKMLRVALFVTCCKGPATPHTKMLGTPHVPGL